MRSQPPEWGGTCLPSPDPGTRTSEGWEPGICIHPLPWVSLLLSNMGEPLSMFVHSFPTSPQTLPVCARPQLTSAPRCPTPSSWQLCRPDLPSVQGQVRLRAGMARPVSALSPCPNTHGPFPWTLAPGLQKHRQTQPLGVLSGEGPADSLTQTPQEGLRGQAGSPQP